MLIDRCERRAGIGRTTAADQRNRLGLVRGLAERYAELLSRAHWQLDHGLHRGTRVESGADSSREPVAALERGWPGRVTETAEELPTIAGPGRLVSVHVHERDAAAEIAVPCIAHEHRASRGVDLRDDERRRTVAGLAETPLDIRRDRQASRLPRQVLECQHAGFDGSIGRHEHQQFGAHAVCADLEAAVALAVCRDVTTIRQADRVRGGCPDVAGLLVTQVDDFGRRIADRIVRPRA